MLKDFILRKTAHVIVVISMLLVFLYLLYIEDKQIENEDAEGTV